MITIFTPSFADDADTNAQNLTVKEIVARLPSDKFQVTMFYEGAPDPRIAARAQTTLWKWRAHGNTVLSTIRMLGRTPDIYFFPRTGPFDDSFFYWRKALGWRTKVITYYVTGGLDQRPPATKLARNLREADVVIGNSRYVSALLSERLNIQAQTIYDGVDPRFYFPRPENPGVGVPVPSGFADHVHQVVTGDH